MVTLVVRKYLVDLVLQLETCKVHLLRAVEVAFTEVGVNVDELVAHVGFLIGQQTIKQAAVDACFIG